MSPQVSTQLVDFSAIEKSDAYEQRSELIRHVASLFALTSETCSVEQLGIYDMVLVRLSDMVEAEVRRHVAERLANLRRVPENTVQKLARDDISVAEPILLNSVALSDNDLLDIACSLGIDHASKIAERDVLSDVVTDALIALDNLILHKKVLENKNAQISEDGFQKLLMVSLAEEGLQEPLSERQDAPDRIIASLINQATDTVRQKLIDAGHAQDVPKVTAASSMTLHKMSNEYWLSRYDFESAWQRVNSMAQWGRVDEKQLRQFALQDRFADAVAAFSIIAGVPFEHAKHWLVRIDPTPFLIMARAHSFDRITVKAMLGMGAWRHRLSPEDRAAAFRKFEKIGLAEAVKLTESWRGAAQQAA